MKEVSTKETRPSSRVGIILLLIGLLGFGFAMYWFSRPAPLPPPEALPDTSVTLFEAQPEALLSFSIRRPNEEAYTVLKSNSSYLLEGFPYYQLNLATIDRMAESLVFLSAEDTLESSITQSGMKPEEFGLGKAALEITARFTQNREYTLLIGDRVPGEPPRDYGMVKGQDALYALSPSIREEFDHPKTWLHAVPSINFSPDLLDSIAFKSKQGTLTIERIFSDVWAMKAPYSYPVSAESAAKLKDKISGMRLAGFVDLANRMNLEDYGLKEPESSVDFRLAPSLITKYSDDFQTSEKQTVDAQQIHLDFGKEIEGVGYYCLYDGAVYQVTYLTMGFLLEAKAEDYLSSFPVNIPLNRVNAFSVSSVNDNGKALRVSLVEAILPNNQISRNEKGEMLYHFAFTDELGNEVETESGIELYKALMAIRFTGEISQPDTIQKHAPLFKVKLKFGDHERIIKFYPYDALHAAIEIDGTVRSYTDMSYLDAVSQAFSRLSGE